MKKNLWALAAIAVVMFLLPGATALFAPHDAGMAICFLLFFGLNNLFSLYVGIYSGLNLKQRWYLPLVNGLAFLLGVWTVFDWGNPDFYGYMTAYLVIGVLTMFITVIVVRNIRKELNQK